jgi:hypothetical protein
MKEIMWCVSPCKIVKAKVGLLMLIRVGVIVTLIESRVLESNVLRVGCCFV